MVYNPRPQRPPRTVLHDVVATSPNLAPSTRNKYERDLDEWVRFAGSDPSGWTFDSAQRFYQSLLDGGMKPQSANRLLASIRYASKWWCATQNRADFCLVRQARGKPGKVFMSLSPDEATALILSCSSRATQTPIELRDQTLIIIALETGMRRMSLEGMRLEAIHTKPYPRVEVPIKGSGETLYSVPLSDAAMRTLDVWRDWLASKKVRTGPVFRQIVRHVTPNTMKVTFDVSDVGISNTMIHKLVVKHAKHAGIQDAKRPIHPHLFRHTFVMWRKEAGVDESQISAITGHDRRDIGGQAEYHNAMKLGAIARNSTPPWFAELVTRILG